MHFGPRVFCRRPPSHPAPDSANSGSLLSLLCFSHPDMSSLLSDKPTNAFQSLFNLMKSLTDTNREMHNSPIEQRDLLRWRRDALEGLTEPWKGATRLAGRQRFEREIRVLRRRFTDGEIRHVEDLVRTRRAILV